MEDITGNMERQSKLLEKAPKPLSTLPNLTLLSFFSFFTSANFAIFVGLGVLKYIQWGLTLVELSIANLIFLTIYTLTQVIVAIYADKMVSIYGRRKPFVFVGYLIRYLVVIAVAAPPVKNTEYIFAWYASFGSLFSLGWGVANNPMFSWFIESTVDDADYMKIMSISFPIGGVIGSIVSLFFVIADPVLSAIVLSVVGIACLMATVYFIPGTVYRQAPAVPPLIPSLRICIQSPEFRTILTVSIIVNAAQYTFSGLVLFLFSTCFDLQNQAFAVQLLLYSVIIGSVIGVCLVVACNWILARVEKIRIFAGVLFVVTACAGVVFFATLTSSTLYLFFALTVLIGAFAFPGNLIIQLFVRDLVIYDTFLTRFNRENMYLTAQGIPTSIMGNFIATIPVIIITLSGFRTKQADDDHIDNNYSWNSASIWVLRLFASLFVGCLAMLAFFMIRNYPLTQGVTEKINEVVKRREMIRESGDLELRDGMAPAMVKNPMLANGGSNFADDSSIIATTALEAAGESGDWSDNDVTVTNEEREILLHMSVSELYRVYSAIDSKIYRPEQGIYLIKNLSKFGFLLSLTALGLMFAALIVNIMFIGGVFSTLIIYFLLLLLFYTVYEFFRYTTIRKMIQWNPKDLKFKTRKIYREFTTKGDTLATTLAREGIHLDAIAAEEATTRLSATMMDMGVSPKSILETNVLKDEDIQEEAFVGLNGYRRIFAILFGLCGASIALIIGVTP